MIREYLNDNYIYHRDIITRILRWPYLDDEVLLGSHQLDWDHSIKRVDEIYLRLVSHKLCALYACQNYLFWTVSKVNSTWKWTKKGVLIWKKNKIFNTILINGMISIVLRVYSLVSSTYQVLSLWLNLIFYKI